MSKTKNLSSVFFLLLSNLFPIIGLLFFGWEITYALFIYWSENLIIAFYNVLKIAKSASSDNYHLLFTGHPRLNKGFYILFFCLHFGIFTVIDGIFVIILLISLQMVNMPGQFFGEQLFAKPVFITLVVSILALLASHGFSFFSNYLGKCEYQNASLNRLLIRPYSRVIIVHLSVFTALLLTPLIHSSQAAGMALILTKTIADLFSHLAEREKYRLASEITSDIHTNSSGLPGSLPDNIKAIYKPSTQLLKYQSVTIIVLLLFMLWIFLSTIHINIDFGR